MDKLYLTKLHFPVNVNIRELFAGDEIDVDRSDEFVGDDDQDMTIEWMGEEVVLHSSIGLLDSSCKLKVYYYHPRSDVMTTDEKGTISDGLGALFVEELFRDRLDIDYGHVVNGDGTVLLKSSGEELLLEPGDTFERLNGETWVFFGSDGFNSLHFDSMRSLKQEGDTEVDVKKIVSETDMKNTSIRMSPTILAHEYAFRFCSVDEFDV